MTGSTGTATGARTAEPAGPARRWWAPGVTCAAGGLVVGTVLAAGWFGWTDGGCGDPQAKFACLVESLVAMVAAVALGPLLVWWAFRRSGVRRAFPAAVVSVVVALVLLAGVGLQEHVRLLGGSYVPPGSRPPAPLVGAWLGLALLGGGLALQGPRRVLRGGLAATALVLLVVAAGLLQGPADRARDGLDLDRSRVPLLLPDGWQSSHLHVSADGGSLSYDAVPDGWAGHGTDGLKVRVTADVDRLGDSCSYRACTDVGDIRVEVPEGDGGLTAWRVVDGALVTVTRYRDAPADILLLDPVEVLQRLETVEAEEFLDRRLVEPLASPTTGSRPTGAQRT